jgi:murein DD-endopeptidase MepM/ murein hydrolase activator NlpD
MVMIIYSVDVEKFKFPLPEKYRNNITSYDTLREDIYDINTGGIVVAGTYHNALDIACPEGTPVYASKAGYVNDVYPSYYNGPYAFKGHPVYGGYIEILHYDGTKSIYAHLSFTNVKIGEYVTQKQLIGKSGGVAGKRGSGKSTGPHLHFEIMMSTSYFME